MKKLTRRHGLIAWLTAVLLLTASIGGGALLTSCADRAAQSVAADTADTDTVGLSAEEQAREEGCHDLSEKGSVQLTGTLEAGQIAIGKLTLLTNTGQITVTNNSDWELTILLYNELDMEQGHHIMKHTLEAGASVDFTNLTHAYNYRVGGQSDEAGDFELLITD